MLLTSPIPGFAPIVGFAVFGLACDGAECAPCGSALFVLPALFLFGKLLVGNEFFHNRTSFMILNKLYQIIRKQSNKRFVILFLDKIIEFYQEDTA